MRLLEKWFISALALLLVAYIVPGIFVSSLGIALIVALILGLLNALIRPVLFILTLPINVLTLGLFTFVLNGLIFWFVSSFIQGFEVDSFVSAVVGSFVVSLISWIGNYLLNDSRSHPRREHPRSQTNDYYYHIDKIEKPNDRE